MSKSPAIVVARRNTKVEELYKRLKSDGVNIKPRAVKDVSWGSTMTNKVAEIFYCECKKPDAALAHELLHLDVQLSGYKRVRCGVSDFDLSNNFRTIIQALDNELQHHKFFQDFLNLGFAPAYFYCDSDIGTEQRLRRGLSQKNTFPQLIPHFLTLIGPGGHMTAETQAELFELFCESNAGANRSQFQALKAIIDQWAESDSYDSEPVLRDIMLTLKPKPNRTWFGFEKANTFPNKGFYVDVKFDSMI